MLIIFFSALNLIVASQPKRFLSLYVPGKELFALIELIASQHVVIKADNVVLKLIPHSTELTTTP